MKVVGINGSARKDGNTALIINAVFEELEKKGIKTELLQMAGSPVRGCRACFACVTNQDRKCVITDDIVNECIAKMSEADGIILGSPVYLTDVTAEMKAFIDRASLVSRANGYLFKYKAGAAVMAVRRGGATHALDTMNHFMHYNQMFQVGATYWNMVFGRQIGEVKNDEEGMQNMRVLGENMAWLIAKIKG